ncbi:MAG: response regulator [Verrucomicrobiales bacterium]|jgi:two-component system response regulator RegA|nr:response regulator [Verrucomicrobiales bacterium]
MNTAAQRLLLADDDAVFRERLAVALGRRGYEVRTAADGAAALRVAAEFAPRFAVVDLKMANENGLTLIRELKERHAALRIIMLTGYGSIATALEAVRLGAADYLTKPADVGQIEDALRGRHAGAGLRVPSLDRVEWEHLQRVLADCGNNISRAARVLGIDRRSLQRKLAKYPPRR